MSKQGDHSPERRSHFITDEDREWLKRRIKETGTSWASLAKKVGLTRQTLYFIRDGVTKETREWSAIVAAVGGTPPSGLPPVTDARLREFIRRWPDLSEADKQMLEGMARRLSLKKS